jgi:aspartyl-tRNA(Asn)/glutamyl-tRNA(Gln) amidotransferase subunit A
MPLPRATAIRNGEISAKAVVSAALERIATHDRAFKLFYRCHRRYTALADAERVDKAIFQGENPGTLAGVPFAVKNLFDIAGLTTLAGSKINAKIPQLPKMQQPLPDSNKRELY